MTDILEIQATLHAYRDFSECIVTGIVLENFGTTVKVLLDYIWNADGTVKGESDESIEVTLTFRLLQDLDIRNRLGPENLVDPSSINWSHSEVALVEVRADERSQVYDSADIPFFHCTLWWEQHPWIEIIAASLDFAESQSTRI